MKVAEVMQTKIKAVAPDATVGEAVVSLADGHVSGLPVVDDRGALLGVLSTTDILTAVAEAGGADERGKLVVLLNRSRDADAIAWATGGGEDYELLVVCDPDAARGLAEGLERATGTRLHLVGGITAAGDGVTLADAAGRTGDERHLLRVFPCAFRQEIGQDHTPSFPASHRTAGTRLNSGPPLER